MQMQLSIIIRHYHSPLQKQEGRQWWLLVLVSITFLLSGQAVGTLLGNFYYDQGGESKWLATLVQSAAFPILFVPLWLFPSTATTANTTAPSIASLASLYTSLGVLFVMGLYRQENILSMTHLTLKKCVEPTFIDDGTFLPYPLQCMMFGDFAVWKFTNQATLKSSLHLSDKKTLKVK
ncbi:hypothetical protein AAC387_Pa07g3055 [Persea americana]